MWMVSGNWPKRHHGGSGGGGRSSSSSSSSSSAATVAAVVRSFVRVGHCVLEVIKLDTL